METVNLYGLKCTAIKSTFIALPPKIYGYKAIHPETKLQMEFKTREDAEYFAQQCRQKNLI